MSPVNQPATPPGPAADKVFAPFSPDQTVHLNNYQHDGIFHEFTCPYDGQALTAYVVGWRCPRNGCSYQQDWAWTFMTRPAAASRWLRTRQ